MRILDQAIEEKLNQASAPELAAQEWIDFEKEAENAEIWLFGVGEGADFFLRRYGESMKISGAVDNDTGKQGNNLRDYLDSNGLEGIKVSDPLVLSGREKRFVVLITSIRYCDAIYEQLASIGVNKIYSLLHMEANYRLKHNSTLSPVDEKCKYAADCTNRAIQKNKIILARDGLGGHGKQILLKLHEMRPELELVWVTEGSEFENIEGVRIVPQSNWKEYIYELETAEIWLFGDMIPEYAIKRPGQTYIHLKHWASITLKSFYFHLQKHLETKSIYDYYRHNTDAMDYCFVGSKFDEDTCRSGFDFKRECIYVGSPRSDVLFREGIREKVYEQVGIKEDVHTILYAPTFRSKNAQTLIGHMREVDLEFEMLQCSLKKRFGGEWRILLRIHPDVAMESRGIKKPDYVVDVTSYPDSEELVAASDLMISDYSSIMFEPAFVDKPVFLYAPDADDYINNDRELLLDYYSLPFPIAKSNDELRVNIEAFDDGIYHKKVTDFLSAYGVHEDGHAAERAATFIISMLERVQRSNK